MFNISFLACPWRIRTKKDSICTMFFCNTDKLFIRHLSLKYYSGIKPDRKPY